MSFYNTQTPSRFSTQNPNTNTSQNVQFLRSGFQQPSSDNSLSNLSGLDLTYTPEQIINRYIVRSNLSGPSIDVFADASDVIDALNNNQWIRATAQDSGPLTIQNGFYFDLTIVNQDSNSTITLTAGMGITVGLSGSITIGPSSAVVIRVQVLSVTNPSIYLNSLTTDSVPAGVINPFAGVSAPSGYLLCNGAAVSRELYSSLFTVIGETYGPGDGLVTFNVPDLRGRVPVGLTGASSYFGTLAGAGGVTDVTLTINQMPTHSHTGTTDSAGSHTHTSNSVGGQGNPGLCIADGTNTVINTDASAGELNVWTTPIALSINANGDHTHTFTSTNTGGGQSHTNIQPYLTVNYIIKY